MADQIKRLNYFKHQFLRASDFIDEQKYHIEMRRRHNSTLHTWGVAGGGLKVSFAQGATAVKVAEGMAIDSQGREIILTSDRTVELAGLPPGAPAYITISYAERRTDPSTETGAEGDTRWTEEPVLQAATAKPSDVGTQLILARVSRTGTTVTGQVDESERRSAGVETGELTIRTLKLSRPDVDAGAWPRLTCSAANQAALENGSLRIDNNREILFADAGQIRSLDNSHRLVFNRPANRLELHEFGDIVFLTGGAAPAERMRVGATGNVGIGRAAANDKLEVQGGVRATMLTFTDAAGTPYPDNWLGMAANIEGATKWMHVGGITDAGARRLALISDRIYTNGRLGIGTVNPGFPLSFADALGDKIALWGQTGNHYGFGIQGALLQIHTDSAGSDIAFGFGSSAAFTERVRIKGNGNVGIGVNPATALHIQSGEPNIRIDSTADRSVVQLFRKGTPIWDFGACRAADNTDFWIGDFSAYRFVIQKGTGYVGIGVGGGNPAAPLHIGGVGAISDAAAWTNIGSNSFYDGGWKRIDPTKPGVNLHMSAISGGNQEFRFWREDTGNPRNIAIIGSGFSFFSSNVSIGHTSPGHMLDVAGRSRFRDGGGSAGLWMFNNGADRAFIGMRDDDSVGFFGNAGSGWALTVNTKTGEVEIPGGRTFRAAGRLHIAGDEHLYLLNKSGVIVGKEWGGNGNLWVQGRLTVDGGKNAYVMDQFVNNLDETLEQGDVVVIGSNQAALYYGKGNNIPVPEADLTDKAYDTRVCGVVCEVHGPLETEGAAPQAEADADAASSSKPKASRKRKQSEPEDETKVIREFTSEEAAEQGETSIKPGQVGYMVTLGAFAHCKVDADIASIEVGDLLTTSPTKGHAQKVLDPSKALGAVIGKALGSLKKGRGKIPILVTLH